MSRGNRKRSIEDGLAVAVATITAQHYVNAPGHGRALVQQLAGYARELVNISEDDPLLYAYAIAPYLEQMYPFVIQAYTWAQQVQSATPDELEDSGAMLCP